MNYILNTILIDEMRAITISIIKILKIKCSIFGTLKINLQVYVKAVFWEIYVKAVL